MCHVSRVTRHASHVIFFLLSDETYLWRVCYQLGLPHLVLEGLEIFGFCVLSLRISLSSIVGELTRQLSIAVGVHVLLFDILLYFCMTGTLQDNVVAHFV